MCSNFFNRLLFITISFFHVERCSFQELTSFLPKWKKVWFLLLINLWLIVALKITYTYLLCVFFLLKYKKYIKFIQYLSILKTNVTITLKIKRSKINNVQNRLNNTLNIYTFKEYTTNTYIEFFLKRVCYIYCKLWLWFMTIII